MPVSLDLRLDGRVLAFTLIDRGGDRDSVRPRARVAIGARRSAGRAQGDGRGVVEGHTRFTIGKALVVGQIALSLVLVIGAVCC